MKSVGKARFLIHVVAVLGLVLATAPATGADARSAQFRGATVTPERALLVTSQEPAFDPFRGRFSPRLDVLDVDGSRRRLVDGTASDGSWSPDGARVVFRDATGIGVINRDGTGSREVLPDAFPAKVAWAPDGTGVLANDVNGRLLVVNVDSGEPRVLHDAGAEASVTAASWAPGGARAAFVVAAAGGDALMSVAADGSDLRTHVTGADLDASGADVPVAWSSDGATVAAFGFPTSQGAGTDFESPSLYLADVSGGVNRLDVPSRLHGGLLSPDLSRIAGVDGHVLTVHDLQSGPVIAADLPLDADATAFVPLWTGEGIYVVAATGETGRLFLADDDTGAVTELRADVRAPFTVDNVDPSPIRPPLPGTVARALHWSRTQPAQSVPRVLIGRADDFADALASGGLQTNVDGVLLLTPTDRLHEAVADEIVRLGASRAQVLGGPAAVSDEVITALEALGLVVERLQGPTRLDTAVAVADEVASFNGFPPSSVVLARAFGDGDDPTRAFADALAGGSLAATLDAPLLLTASDSLSEPVSNFLDRSPTVSRVIVLGGTAAVSSAVESALVGRGLEVVRLSGAGRAETAAAIREFSLAASPTSIGAPDILVPVDGGDPSAWADGFAVAGLTGTGGGGAVVISDHPATWASFVDVPGSAGVVCPSLTPAIECEEVQAALNTTESPDAVHDAGTSDGARTASFRYVAGQTVCLRAAVEGNALTRVVIRGTDDTLPSFFSEHEAVGGELAVCDRALFSFGLSPEALDRADLVVEWVTGTGSPMEAPLRAA